MSKCQSCGKYQLSKDEWFCSYCGSIRVDCPSCGNTMGKTDRECGSCGQARYAPCKKCEELTPMNKGVCENCGYNEGAAMESRSNKFMGVGVILSLLGGSLVLGIIGGGLVGSIAGAIGVLAGIVTGGLGVVGRASTSVDSPAAPHIGKKTNRSSEADAEALDTAINAAGTAASAGADAVESYDQHKQEKEERERKRQEEKREQQIKAKRENIKESVQDAKNSPGTVLWEMNCEGCGMPWVTTQSKKIARSDDFETVGFNIVNESEWEYIQDRVQIQCEAPDCNHTSRFTKESLWTP